MLKELLEKRAELIEKMEKITSLVETEKRAMNEEEMNDFQSTETEIRGLDDTIEALQRASKLANTVTAEAGEARGEDTAQMETRAFANFIRGVMSEQRANNLTFGDNGAVIPTTIANQIIAKVRDISPVFERATRYNVRGKLLVPYYDESTTSIKMEYADEFTNADSNVGQFKSVELNEFLGRTLALVSKSVINNSDFDIVNEVVNQMSIAIASFLEHECLVGTVSKATGLSDLTNTTTAASATAIIMDDIIKLKDKVKSVYQNDSIFIMHSETMTALRLLKDNNGRYLLQDDVTKPFGISLLGKSVYVSDNMPKMATGNRAIYYGDMRGLTVKVSEDININVLREKYAEQHAIGILGFVEFDAKITNAQMIACLVMA